MTRDVYMLLADVLERRAAAAAHEPRKLEGRAEALADQVQQLVAALPATANPPTLLEQLRRLGRLLLALRTALGRILSVGG